MLHTKPTKRFEKKTGVSESFNIDSEQTKFAINTNAGGYDKYEGINDERHFYIINGLGTATIKGEDYIIESGSLLRVPKASAFSVEGQFKYALIQGDSDVEIIEQSVDTPLKGVSKGYTFVYILTGLGNVTMDGKTSVLKDGAFVEIPNDVEFSVLGALTYILITEK